MQRFERGENIPPRENVSWLRRLDEKLRGIYAAVTCRRSSDVAIPRPAHRPPRPSLQRSEPRPSVHRSEPRPSQPGSSSWQQTPPSQPGSSSWQQPPPSQPGSSSWQQPPPSQPGSYIWHNQMELGNTTFYILFNILGIVYQRVSCFTLPQSAASRNRSCSLTSSHRCIVVVVRSLPATAMTMTELETPMSSRREFFRLHNHHGHRRHSHRQTTWSMVVVIVRLVHRLSAYRFPVLVRGRPGFVAVPPSSDMVIRFLMYVLLSMYESLSM